VAGGVTLSNAVTLSNSAVTLGGSNPLALTGAVALNGLNNTVAVTNTALTAFVGVVSGTGNLIKAGAGTLVPDLAAVAGDAALDRVALPRVGPHASFIEMLGEMTGKGLGFTAIVDADGRALGIFTDGDLRRLIERGADLRALHAQDVMHRQPRSVSADALAVDAAEVMERHAVTSVSACSRLSIIGAMIPSAPASSTGAIR
jgi:CBS-domain-containing membrane protein